ncbi:MAG: hypothetical protein LBM19_04185 [Holosporales bacterium]|nr:hypothetical protein [Holosporales bacterium]
MTRQELSSVEIFKRIFKQYYSKFLAERETANTMIALKRIPESGQIPELAFKNFFLSILPEYVGITRGIIFDRDGEKHSNEIDIIFYDKRCLNGFLINEKGDDSVSYISIDAVFGVVQVEKTLNWNTFDDAIKNLNSVYNLLPGIAQTSCGFQIGSLRYNSAESDKVFSCIFAMENKIFYKKDEAGTEKPMNNSEIIDCIEKNINKYSFLQNMLVDLIYTCDGSILNSYEKNNEYSNLLSIMNLGEAKHWYKDQQYIEEQINKEKDALLYNFDRFSNEPEKALAIPIICIPYWHNRIKNTPKIDKILGKYLKE